MHELFHDFYLLLSLVPIEGMNVNSFESKGSLFAVLDEVDASEAALSDGLDGLIVMHYFQGVLQIII